jgi:rSAM/selenodomain-associated transferase 2
MKVSVIVPVFNETPLLSRFLSHLRERVPAEEVIVVDGGSSDGTWQLAESLREEFCFVLLSAPRGRATQMNAGANASGGDLLWFLHADSNLAPGCADAMKSAASDPALAGGCFRLRMPGKHPLYRVSDSLGNIGVHLFRIALGDHGIFCRRDAFEQIGGYPELPLMEDAYFYEALARYGRVRQLRPCITTSARAYKKYGPLRTTVAYAAILALYVMRAPLAWQLAIFSWNTRATRRPGSRARNTMNARTSSLP